MNASFNEIWVESPDGGLSKADIHFNCEEKDICWTWQSIQNASEIPPQNFPPRRSDNCESLRDGMFPRNPNGQLMDCVYVELPGAESGSESYFALMSDGHVLYWWNGGNLIIAQALFVFSTFISPMATAVIISVGYFALSVLSRSLKAKRIANG